MEDDWILSRDVYDFNVNRLDCTPFKFREYKNHACILVNVASE